MLLYQMEEFIVFRWKKAMASEKWRGAANSLLDQAARGGVQNEAVTLHTYTNAYPGE